MGFESPIFLAALGAVAAPIIIHLIFRLRKRVVVFGSLRFLEKIVKKNRRRLRLRDLILLLLRIAAVALIALAFARPYLRTGPGAEFFGITPCNIQFSPQRHREHRAGKENYCFSSVNSVSLWLIGY